MTYRVEKIANESGWKSFLDLPERIYRQDPNWVAPLKSEIRRALDTRRNPFFSAADLRLFVCYRSATPVARAIVVINRRHWERWRKKTAFFGFFESENDPEAAETLFETMESYCRDQGAELLEGPFNPHHYAELGLLIGPFDSPARFFETYNPPYYPRLLEGLGFTVGSRLHTRINRNTDHFVHTHPHKDPSRKTAGTFSIRPFDLRNRKADLERIRQVNNDAFSENWHFLPVSQEEYLYTSKFLFFVTLPKLVLIVERGTETVGVLICVLEINKLIRPLGGRLRIWHYPRLLRDRRWIREIVIYSIGIKKRYRNSAVFHLMHEAMCEIVRRYPIVSTTWMTDDNMPARHASDLLGLRPYKWFVIYEKHL